MDVQEKIELTVGMIRGFSRKCERCQYTNTGDAWDILNQIERIWTPLSKVVSRAQNDKKPDIEPISPKSGPEDSI